MPTEKSLVESFDFYKDTIQKWHLHKQLYLNNLDHILLKYILYEN